MMFSSGNMYVFVTLTHKIYQTRQTRQTPVNPYPYPPKPVPLARGKGLEGKGRGTAEIPQGYPCQSLAAAGTDKSQYPFEIAPAAHENEIEYAFEIVAAACTAIQVGIALK